ncbi:MAG: DNA repair protein RecO [Patescibacteria group bacterium]
MTHQIYQTEGVVLKKKDFGEADCFFCIFTEKFGMIKAVAKSARLEKSKLRGGLDLFSFVNLALIFSKDFWKIVDARETGRTGKSNADYFVKIKIFAELANFLVRMIKGEEKNDFIWREIKNFLSAVYDKSVTKEEIKKLGVQTTARILNNLGYMKDVPVIKHQVISAINKAIKESML